VRLLIDTHVLIWWTTDLSFIPSRVQDAMSDPDNEVFVSVATAWEIGTKTRIGKLSFDSTFLDDFDNRVKALGFGPLSLTAAHAVKGARMPGDHKDPFDRILVGQALCEGLTIATADRKLATLGAPTLW
jgi:PIN domain nuclease of toxin-antitoxin system